MKINEEKNSNTLKSTPNKNNLKMRRLFITVLIAVLSSCITLQFNCSTKNEFRQDLETSLTQKSENSEQGSNFRSNLRTSLARSRQEPLSEIDSFGLPSPAQPSTVPITYESQVDVGQNERIVIHNAVMNVVVERISDSMDQIKTTVTKMGGYMQEMSDESITLKVPAARFQDAIAEAEKLGEVTRKDIKGSDVTEEMRDLNIRLKNAEQVRERLIKLLDRAEKIEDMLNIEKELERITETIELLKGKISYLQNKAAFSTLTVYFNSPVPQEDIMIRTPFRWAHNLGSEMIQPVITQTQHNSFFSNTMFTVPDGFIKYYEDKFRTRAMSANEVIIYSHKEENYKGGNVGFWSSLVRRVLVEQKVIHIDKELELKLNNKNDAVLYVGSKQIGSKKFGYLVTIAATKKYVYIFEAWGPSQEFDNDLSKLETAAKSLQLK